MSDLWGIGRAGRRQVAVMLAIVLLLVGGLLVGRWLEPRPSTDRAVLSVEPQCDIARRACTASAAGLAVTLGIGPQPGAMTPFAMRMTRSDSPADAGAAIIDVVVSFSMVAMDMGRNRYRLVVAGDGDAAVWHGQATLPLCATGRRDWTAELTLTTASGKRYRGVFPFVVQ